MIIFKRRDTKIVIFLTNKNSKDQQIDKLDNKNIAVKKQIVSNRHNTPERVGVI